MATESLVDAQIAAGFSAIRKLRDVGVEVPVAAWVRLSDDLGWRLILALEGVEEGGLQPAYTRLFKLLGPEDMNFNLKIVGMKNPIAKDLCRIRDKYPPGLSARYAGSQIGSMPVEEAYIYPRMESQPEAPKTEHDVLKGVLDQLAKIVQSQSRVHVILKTRESIDGVLTGVDFANGVVFLRLLDLKTHQQRSIELHDVIALIDTEQRAVSSEEE